MYSNDIENILNTLMRQVGYMRDYRERWKLETSYHKVIEDYLGVAPIKPVDYVIIIQAAKRL